jgi:multidrug resistance efflux pump
MESKQLKNNEDKKGNKLLYFITHHNFLIAIVIIIATILVGVIIYFGINSSRVYIEKSEINAPIISLSSQTPGIIDRLFVKEGDVVGTNLVVAEVNGQSIKTKTSGLITSVQNTPGQFVSSNTPIVEMIDPSEFRVIGHLDEDKGLNKIKPGQTAIFSVDTFGSKKFYGSVESVSPSARQQDIVFSISDKREIKQFDIFVKFDTYKYPELKNGMSAKLWIYVQ